MENFPCNAGEETLGDEGENSPFRELIMSHKRGVTKTFKLRSGVIMVDIINK